VTTTTTTTTTHIDPDPDTRGPRSSAVPVVSDSTFPTFPSSLTQRSSPSQTTTGGEVQANQTTTTTTTTTTSGGGINRICASSAATTAAASALEHVEDVGKVHLAALAGWTIGEGNFFQEDWDGWVSSKPIVSLLAQCPCESGMEKIPPRSKDGHLPSLEEEQEKRGGSSPEDGEEDSRSNLISPSIFYNPGSVWEVLMEIADNPHPLDTLATSEAYGDQGSVSRHHNPDNYARSLRALHEARRRRWAVSRTTSLSSVPPRSSPSSRADPSENNKVMVTTRKVQAATAAQSPSPSPPSERSTELSSLFDQTKGKKTDGSQTSGQVVPSMVKNSTSTELWS
jgi:hypothetical protein